MGGLFGFFGLAGPPQGTLGRMAAALAHRGADGVFTEALGEGAGLGAACFLPAAPAAEVAGGPAVSRSVLVRDPASGVALALDADVANLDELRATLGERNGGLGAAEAFLRLFARRGVDFVLDVRGAFAFAVVDPRNRRVHLVRDRLGAKPLYYAAHGGGILFASELKALLAAGALPRAIDREAIHDYLTYQYVPAPRTVWKGARKVSHASVLEFRDGRATERRWWTLPFLPKTASTYEESRVLLRARVEDSARHALAGLDGFTVLLSGGIDSTLVAGLLTRLTGGPVRALSIGFEEKAFDESEAARLVAGRIGAAHEVIVLGPDSTSILPEIARAYEEPYADSSALPTFHVMRAAGERARVAFLGDGGDDSFAGYLRYWAFRQAERLDLLPGALVRPAAAAALAAWPRDVAHRSLAGYGRRFLDMLRLPPADRYARLVCHFTNEMKAELCTDDFADAVRGADSLDMVRRLYAEAEVDDAVDRLLYVDLNSYMPGDLVVKVEVAAAHARVVPRAPLLDPTVMEFAARLPADWKLRGRTSKRILKDAFADLIPAEILSRPKTGFGAPIEAWFRGPLLGTLRDRLVGSLAKRGLFRREALERLIEDHRAGRANRTYPLWNLLMLEHWYEEHVDRA